MSIPERGGGGSYWRNSLALCAYTEDKTEQIIFSGNRESDWIGLIPFREIMEVALLILNQFRCRPLQERFGKRQVAMAIIGGNDHRIVS